MILKVDTQINLRLIDNLNTMISDNTLEEIYLKIFERAKISPLGVLEVAAKMGYSQNEYRITYMIELKQQIDSCRNYMIELFGEEIINDIDNLDLKYKKLRQITMA